MEHTKNQLHAGIYRVNKNQIQTLKILNTADKKKTYKNSDQLSPIPELRGVPMVWVVCWVNNFSDLKNSILNFKVFSKIYRYDRIIIFSKRRDKYIILQMCLHLATRTCMILGVIFSKALRMFRKLYNNWEWWWPQNTYATCIMT